MPTDALSRTFAALAHPARRAMLAKLSAGEASVQDLARPFKLSAPAISKHLKVLEQAGLITRTRQAQWRPCRMEGKKMKEATDWMDACRKEWELRFDQLEAYLHEIQVKPPKPDKGD